MTGKPGTIAIDCFAEMAQIPEGLDLRRLVVHYLESEAVGSLELRMSRGQVKDEVYQCCSWTVSIVLAPLLSYRTRYAFDDCSRFS